MTLTRASGLREQVLRIAFAIAGAVLLTAALAQAQAGPAYGTGAPAGADLAAQIAARVALLLPDSVRLRSVGLQFAAPEGAVVESVAPGIAQLRSRAFMVQLMAQGRTLFYTATVDAERPIIVAKRDIEANHAVAESDVETRWVEAFGAASGALRELPAGADYMAASPLRAGEPIYPSNLTRTLAVHPGDLVNVIVKNGPVTVRTQLESRSAAAIGESAMMVNPASGTMVNVSVTGPKMAELVMQ